MQSKNKPAQTQAERSHVASIKAMDCIVCSASGPSEAHEIEQGAWFLSVPLCADCHRGSRNGIHGERRMWAVKRMNELSALNETLRRVFSE
jgi:hypothetical protein